MSDQKDRNLLIEELEALGNLINGEAPAPMSETAPTPSVAHQDTGQSQTPQKVMESQNDGPETVDMFSPTSSENSGGYLDELVDELLAAVEKRLTMHAGEPLPESLRDALADDIRARLAPWWSDQ